MSNRDLLIEYIETVLADTPGLQDIKVVKSARSTDQLSKPILIVKTDGYEKLAQAPLTKRSGNFTATLVSPHVDMDKAEDDLDDRLEILLPKLFTSGLVWSAANMVGFGEQYSAFDITIQSILTSDT